MARSRGTGRKEQGVGLTLSIAVKLQTYYWTICFEALRKRETLSGKGRERAKADQPTGSPVNSSTNEVFFGFASQD